MKETPRRNMKVVLKSGLVLGNVYGQQTFDSKNSQAKGKILTIDDTSGSIFNVKNVGSANGGYFGVFDKEMVNLLDSINKDELFNVYVQSDMSDDEYVALRRGRS